MKAHFAIEQFMDECVKKLVRIKTILDRIPKEVWLKEESDEIEE